MKAIHAYVRQHSAARVIDALALDGCVVLSVVQVRGLTPGLPSGTYEFSVELAQQYEPILKLEVVTTDDLATRWADLIARAASTQELGDGMVFVLPVDAAIRISDGMRGERALVVPGQPPT